MPQGWILDERANAGSEHLDLTYVPTYDRKSGTDPSEDVALLRSRGMSSQHTLIDFGAGTGTFALAAAPFCKEVIAVDISPNMLDQLKQKGDILDINNITPVQKGFLSYEHQGEKVDFAYSRNALHHLPDFWKTMALGKIASSLKVGGMFLLRDLVFSCGVDEVKDVIDSWLGNASDSPELGWTRTELETHIREEYSTYSWLLEPMLEQARFEINQISHVKSRVRSTYLCTKK